MKIVHFYKFLKIFKIILKIKFFLRNVLFLSYREKSKFYNLSYINKKLIVNFYNSHYLTDTECLI